jgi:hypothetical protein
MEMVRGYVIAEGMRAGSQLSGIPLQLKTIKRYAVASATVEQPSVWTMIEFELAEGDAERVITVLSEALEELGGWYSDLLLGDERVVIFGGRVFRYSRGDKSARAEAQAYGRERGVPEQQLDWGD